MSFKTIVAVALLVMPLAAQEQGRSSTCTVHYENRNQIDYGPLVVQDVKGTITDPQQVAVPKVCAGIFTEKDHKLIATAESDAEGKFSLQSVPPGRYRLVVKADPLCAANVPLHVVKGQKQKQVLQVHMKPAGGPGVNPKLSGKDHLGAPSVGTFFVSTGGRRGTAALVIVQLRLPCPARVRSVLRSSANSDHS